MILGSSFIVAFGMVHDVFANHKVICNVSEGMKVNLYLNIGIYLSHIISKGLIGLMGYAFILK